MKHEKPMMQLIEVTTPAQEKEWILFPVTLYKGDPNYIRQAIGFPLPVLFSTFDNPNNL